MSRGREYVDGQPVPGPVSVVRLLLCGASAVSLCDLEDALAMAAAPGADAGLCWSAVSPMLRRLADEIDRAAERRHEVAEIERREREEAEEAAYLAGELDALIGGTLAAIESVVGDERSAAE